jgi:hypothetical protein
MVIYANGVPYYIQATGIIMEPHFQEPNKFSEPHLSQVLQFVLYNPQFTHIVIVRTKGTAELLARLLPSYHPHSVCSVDSFKDGIKLVNSGSTRLLIGNGHYLCVGWRPNNPEICAVSATYSLDPAMAIQLCARLGSAYSEERALIWKQRGPRLTLGTRFLCKLRSLWMKFNLRGSNNEQDT